MKAIVLFDTNFLLLPYQHKIDIFTEIDRVVPEAHELAVLSTVVSEMEKLGSLGGDDGVAARIGLELVRRNGVRIIPAEGRADESIVTYVQENKNVVVCTNDAGLKRRLKVTSVPLIVMRSKSHLVRL